MPGNREFELQLAQQHVREAEAHVERQIQIVGQLQRDGHPTLEAEQLLKVFEETLESQRAGLKELQAAQNQRS